MSEIKRLPTRQQYLEAIRASSLLRVRLQQLVELINRVVVKFPAETLPPSLVPYQRVMKIIDIKPRYNAGDDAPSEFELTEGTHWQARTLVIPAEWLWQPQSLTTAAVRALYWAGRREADDAQRAQLVRSIAHQETQLAHTHRELERLQSELVELDGAIATRQKRTPSHG